MPDEVIAFEDGHMGPCAENLARDCGDFYLRRADGVFAYQLAVVVDDALMGVTQVVRGADLLSSTPRQLWLYRELGLPAPEFYHMPLLLAVNRRRNTVLLVTHEQRYADLCGRKIEISDGKI